LQCPLVGMNKKLNNCIRYILAFFVTLHPLCFYKNVVGKSAARVSNRLDKQLFFILLRSNCSNKQCKCISLTSNAPFGKSERQAHSFNGPLCLQHFSHNLIQNFITPVADCERISAETASVHRNFVHKFIFTFAPAHYIRFHNGAGKFCFTF
jgi:hypothetical protein